VAHATAAICKVAFTLALAQDAGAVRWVAANDKERCASVRAGGTE
jgi:hypothetical protein